MKDKAASLAGEKLLSNKLERYGNMIDFKINSADKTIFLSILLKGEKEPVNIKVNNYSFRKKGDDNYIVLDEVDISREWMNLLAADFLKDKEFKLPEGMISGIIKMVM
ncbi:MAG: hypothetical protein R6W90_01230 [Ignavibacteriaceae bacterium]